MFKPEYQKRRGLRSIKQASVTLAMILCTLLIVGLCTNTIVLPFFNLSAAMVSPQKTLPLKAGESEPVPKTDSLSFLDVLYHFYAQVPEGYAHSLSAYNPQTSQLVLQSLETDAILPRYRTAGGKMALQARQGFLVRSNEDGTATLLTRAGKVILEKIPETLKLSGHWDAAGNAAGNAVFSSDTGFVYYDEAQNAFLPANFNAGLSNIWGIDLSAYYGSPDSDVALQYNGSEYGFYYQSTGDPCYMYYHTGQSYQFREGYGALGTSSGIIIVNRAGTSFFTNYGVLLQPEGEGAALLGFYQFDRGLMRIRVQAADGSVKNMVITKGNTVFSLPADYTVVSYSDGVFLMRKDGRYGYLDYTGRWIAEPIYTYAEPFTEGLAVLGDVNGTKGVIDTAGNFVVPLEFEEVSACTGGIMTLYKNGQWVVLQKTSPA